MEGFRQRGVWLREDALVDSVYVMTLIDHILKAVAVIVIVIGIINVTLLLLLSVPGLIMLFVAAFAVTTAAGSGAALLAIDFLYPGAVAVSGLVDLLWLVVPASLASVIVFDLLLEGLVLRVLRWLGMSMPVIEIVEAVAGGFVTAASLAIVARVLPDVGLSAGAALAAGLIAGFVRYYVGQWFLDTKLGGDPEIDSYVDLDAE